jgi:excisionase family DNA binding protein
MRAKAKRPAGRVKTLDEVAALLRVSRGSAYDAANRGEIPTIRIGKRLLVPDDALEKMLSGETLIRQQVSKPAKSKATTPPKRRARANQQLPAE